MSAGNPKMPSLYIDLTNRAAALAAGVGCFESSATAEVAEVPQLDLPPQSVSEFLLCGPNFDTDSVPAQQFLTALGKSLVGASVVPASTVGDFHG